MTRDFRHALSDMKSAIVAIEQAASGKRFEDFENDWLLRHGIERGIEIISEASRALPDDLLAQHPEIPWARVRAIGNVLRHAYHDVSSPLIWRVVEDELPRLKRAIESMQSQNP